MDFHHHMPLTSSIMICFKVCSSKSLIIHYVLGRKQATSLGGYTKSPRKIKREKHLDPSLSMQVKRSSMQVRTPTHSRQNKLERQYSEMATTRKRLNTYNNCIVDVCSEMTLPMIISGSSHLPAIIKQYPICRSSKLV